MGEVKLGVLLWSQASDWAAFERAARRVDELGYDSLWTWDHLYAIFGDPYQPIFEGYTTLAAWAMVTTRVRLGLLWAPTRSATRGSWRRWLTTLDQMSEGRAILGHRRRLVRARAHRARDRLRARLRRAARLDGRGGRRRSAPLLDGETVTLAAGRPLRIRSSCGSCRGRSRRGCRS